MIVDYDLLAELAREYDYQYQVEELYGNMIAKQLDKDFDVYVDFNETYKEFNCEALGLKISMRDVKDYESLHKIFEEKLSDNADEIHLKNKFKSLMDDFRLGTKVGELYDSSRYSLPTYALLDILWYIKTDEWKRDLTIGNSLEKTAQQYADKYPNDTATLFYPTHGLQYQPRYGSWIDMTTVDPKFSGWELKFFQNGKIQIKGMTQEDWDKLVRLDEICSRK
jgi:hypothetical protein